MRTLKNDLAVPLAKARGVASYLAADLPIEEARKNAGLRVGILEAQGRCSKSYRLLTTLDCKQALS
jgi:hypothetical protein